MPPGISTIVHQNIFNTSFILHPIVYWYHKDNVMNEYSYVTYKKKISKGSISSFSFWKERILIGTTDGYLLEINQKGFDIIKSRHLGSYASAIFSAPAVWKDHVALMSSRFRLYLFN